MVLQGHRGLRWRDPEAPSFYNLQLSRETFPPSSGTRRTSSPL